MNHDFLKYFVDILSMGLQNIYKLNLYVEFTVKPPHYNLRFFARNVNNFKQNVLTMYKMKLYFTKHA